jgi:hypothetical protein
MITTMTPKDVPKLREYDSIYIYGTGRKAATAQRLLDECGLGDRLAGFIDSHTAGALRSKPVHKLSELNAETLNQGNAVIVIASYATMEIAMALRQRGLERHVAFEDEAFSMEQYYEEVFACNLLHFKHGKHITHLREMPKNQRVTVLLDGNRVNSFDVEKQVRDELKKECQGSAVDLLYTADLDLVSLAHKAENCDAFLLYPVFSNTLKGTTKALQRIAKLGDDGKLYILEREHMPMRQCIVLDEQRLLFMPIPKCGSTSILTALRNTLGMDVSHNAHETTGVGSIYRAVNLADKKYASYFKFTLSRHPFTRLASLYKTNNKNRYIPHLLNKATGAEVTFENFCDYVCASPDFLAEAHYKSQHAYICDLQGKRLFDYVGRLESLADTLKPVTEATGLDIPCHHLHRSNHNADGYASFYESACLRERVRARYQKDFDLAGYE